MARYRRKDVYEATQATEAGEVVVNFRGGVGLKQVYEAGDWLVTDPAGQTTAVKADAFEAAFLPI